MILLHHPEVELSRDLLATAPSDVVCIDWTQPHTYDGLPPSAFPTVIVDVPAYGADVPLFGEDGVFLGMARTTIPAHQEALRLPVSWDAVQSFVASVEDRARLNPPVSA